MYVTCYPVVDASFGEGVGPIFLDNVACTGLERTLTQCSHNGIGNNNCRHSEDAGVNCQECPQGYRYNREQQMCTGSYVTNLNTHLSTSASSHKFCCEKSVCMRL